MHAKTIKRSELYRLVWNQPMMHLAKSYGLSDVGLAKICRKYDIPRPTRGYWAKLQHGQQPAQTPLPKLDHDAQISLREVADETAFSSPPIRDEFAEQSVAERHPEQLIEVSSSLRGCHDLVSKANQELQDSRTDNEKMIIQQNKPVLDVRTSKGSLRRALLILDAVLKALEQRGYSVGSGPTVTILDTAIGFGISESPETKQEPRRDVDLDGPYEFGHSRFDEKRVPSGRLTLEIHEGGGYSRYGCQRTWRDTKTKRLEDRLNSFVAGLVEMAVRVREREKENERRAELRRQEEKRRKEEEQRKAERRKEYKTEKARVAELLTQVENFHKSQRVRSLIGAVRQAHEATGPIEPGSDIDRWLEWASQQADRLDPLHPSPPSILDETDLEEQEPPRYGYRW